MDHVSRRIRTYENINSEEFPIKIQYYKKNLHAQYLKGIKNQKLTWNKQKNKH